MNFFNLALFINLAKGQFSKRTSFRIVSGQIKKEIKAGLPRNPLFNMCEAAALQETATLLLLRHFWKTTPRILAQTVGIDYTCSTFCSDCIFGAFSSVNSFYTYSVMFHDIITIILIFLILSEFLKNDQTQINNFQRIYGAHIFIPKLQLKLHRARLVSSISITLLFQVLFNIFIY